MRRLGRGHAAALGCATALTCWLILSTPSPCAADTAPDDRLPAGPAITTLSSPTHPLQRAWYANASPILEWSAADPSGIVGYAYVLDRQPDTEPTKVNQGIAISVSYTDLADGVWYFHVCAENCLGVWGETATYELWIDATPPTTTADAPPNWQRQAVTVTFSATDVDSGVASTVCSTDGGTTWIPCASVLVPAPADHSGDGDHPVLYRSVDAAGNVETPRTVMVLIDTRAPRFAWLGLSPHVLRRSRSVRLSFKLSDGTDRIHVTCRLSDAYGHRVIARRAGTFPSGSRSLSLPATNTKGRPLLPGLYRVRLRLVDAAGNTRLTGARAFRDFRPVQAAVWRRVPRSGRRVALTFDDGYDKAGWAKVLAVLHAHHVRATFFVNGKYVDSSPTLARRTVAWGNAVGSHTWSHILTTTAGSARIRHQLRSDVVAWWRVAHATPVPYFRPPYGSYDTTTLRVAGSLGFARVILWNVDPADYTDPGASTIAERVLSQTRSGSIVVLHLRPQTATALPRIIAGLRARGYELVTLPALFRRSGVR